MKKSQQGQIVIFLLVIIVILVTVLLSLWSRMIQQRKIRLGSERSSRAFSAAEAAVEEALRQDINALIAAGSCSPDSEEGGCPLTGLEAQGISALYSVSQLEEFVIELDQDDLVQVNLKTDTGEWDGSDISVCWEEGDGTNGENPSIELTFYQEDAGGEVSLERYAFNAENNPGNGFTNPGETDRFMANLADPVSPVCVNSLENEVRGVPETITAADATYLRIKTWYAPATVRVVGVPDQVIQALGQAETAVGEKRTVGADTYPASWPPIFDYVLFDGSANPLQK